MRDLVRSLVLIGIISMTTIFGCRGQEITYTRWSFPEYCAGTNKLMKIEYRDTLYGLIRESQCPPLSNGHYKFWSSAPILELPSSAIPSSEDSLRLKEKIKDEENNWLK